MKKIVSFSAALIMISCLCAVSCGRQTEYTNEVNTVMNAESISDQSISTELSAAEQPSDSAGEDHSVSTDCYVMEKIALPDDVNYIYKIENVGSNEIRIFYSTDDLQLREYSTDAAVSNFAFVDKEIPQECIDADHYYALNDMRTDSDGSIIYSIEDHGGKKLPEFFDEYFDYDDDFTRSFILADYKDGKVVSTAPIEFPEDIYVIDSYGNTNDLKELDMIADFEDYMLFNTGAGEIFRINKADRSVEKIADILAGADPEIIEKTCFQSYISRDRDGEPCITYTDFRNGDGSAYNICQLSGDTLSEPLAAYEHDMIYPITGYGKYRVIVCENKKICGICDDGSKEIIVDLEKSGLDNMDVCPVGNGEFIGYYQEETDNGEYVPHLVKLTPSVSSEQ